MLVRKTLKHRQKGGKRSFTRKRRHQQVGRGEEESNESGITGLFSLPFTLGGSTEKKSSDEPTSLPKEEDKEISSVEPDNEPEVDLEEKHEEETKNEPEEEPEEEKLSDVSPVQSAFEMYYGVDSGDVVADKPDVDYPNLHKELLKKENGSIVFNKTVKKGEDIAVLHHSSIGFKNGIYKYPACEFLENISFPDSPPNVVVEIKKLPIRSTDRKGVYVKTMALVLKTLEEVLPGTVLNVPYLPSLNSTTYVNEDKVDTHTIDRAEEASIVNLKDEDENEEDLEEDLEEEVRIGSMDNQEGGKGSLSVISMEDLGEIADISTPQQSEPVESVEPIE